MSNLDQQPILTVTHGHDHELIYDTTRQLRQCMPTLLSLLEARCQALASSAQFDAALADSSVMRSIAPSSPLGYICAGDVYAAQGRQSAALDAYNQGLELVPRSGPGYTRLRDGKEKAALAISKRVDFISKLPLDVVLLNIMPRFMEQSVDSRCQYLHVCRSWCRRIMQSENQHFKIKCGQGNTSWQWLTRIVPNIRSLCLAVDYVPGDIAGVLRQAVEFRSLTQLQIRSHDDCLLTNDITLMETLSCIGSRLTKLTINVSTSPPLDLHAILNCCPNLALLRLSHFTLSEPLSGTYHEMRELLLDNVSPDLRYIKPTELLPHFPDLRSLSISPCLDTHALSIVHEFCPLLQNIECCCSGTCSGISSNADQHEQQTQPGLKTVHLESSGVDVYRADDVVSLVGHHSNTIESLTFKGVLEDPDDTQFSPVQFGRLRNLSFSLYNRSAIPFCVWVMQNAPNVHTVELELTAVHSETIHALMNLSQLNELRLGIQDGTEHEDVLNQFLDQNLSLKELHVVVDQSMHNKPWLSSISRLPQLRSLHLTVSDHTLHRCFLPFIKRLYRSQLKSLDLVAGEIHNDMLSSLHTINRLKYLRISSGHVSERDLLSLLSCKRLKHLTLNVRSLRQETLAILQAKIPEVTFYAHFIET